MDEALRILDEDATPTAISSFPTSSPATTTPCMPSAPARRECSCPRIKTGAIRGSSTICRPRRSRWLVTGGATNNLGTVTWTPTRVGPTVFEIGYPDRKGDKFRHGDDYWVGDVGPSPTAPSPVWTKFMEFPFDFPNGLNYVVGQNRWNTDWNFIQSVYPDFRATTLFPAPPSPLIWPPPRPAAPPRPCLWASLRMTTVRFM